MPAASRHYRDSFSLQTLAVCPSEWRCREDAAGGGGMMGRGGEGSGDRIAAACITARVRRRNLPPREPRGQQFDSGGETKSAIHTPDATPRQALRARGPQRCGRVVTLGAIAVFCTLLCGILGGLARSAASGPLVDPLDGRPLGWRLSEADCPAAVEAHWLDAAGGLDRRPCEAITLATGNGTRAILEYRLPPSRVIDEVRATVAVQAVAAGARVGIRLRYPRLIDPATRAPAASIVWGQSHRGRGQWEVLAATPELSARRLREMALRGQFGSGVDLDDAYVDAVVINAYTGPGRATVRLDNLRVDGLVAAGSVTAGNASPAAGATRTASTAKPAGVAAQPAAARSGAPPVSSIDSAFPAGRLTRVLEYNGEPLDYLRLLGFDAVLLSRPPTADLLREAVRQGIAVYAPPPTAPVPELEPLLSPLAGWYLGTSLDESQLKLAASEAERIGRFPSLWQRPAMVAPAESWDRFAGVATTLVYDLPPAVRGLSGTEQSRLLMDQVERTGRPVAAAVGVATMPPQRLIDQLDMLSRSLGAAKVEDFAWHPIWLQAMEAMKIGPRAIVFRSTRSLASGRQADSQRAAILSMVNRWLSIVGAAASGSRLRGILRSNRDDYQVAHLASERVELVVATRDQTAAAAMLDGPPTLQFRLPPGAPTYAWRVTDTVLEQLNVAADGAATGVSIDSPDWVEWIVLSNDASVGVELDRVLRRHAVMLNQDRWQLVSGDLLRTREDWRSAVGGGLVPRAAVPSGVLRDAANRMADVQPVLAAGRFSTAMQTTRTADAMGVQAARLLAGRLQPGVIQPTGLPTLLAPGATQLQLAWRPILDDGRWTANLLAGGEFDDADTMIRSGWTHQMRLASLAEANVGVDPAAGSDGGGALRIEASARGAVPLPGGYAGTVIRVRSGPVRVPVGSWVRIDARVRTLGFGGPHQGLLVYDSDAGSEIGTLVRGDAGWQNVRLYRTVTAERPLRVIFEGLGDGEALIDSVGVSMWQPPGEPAAPLRPLASSR